MDKATAGILRYLIKVTDGIANVALIGRPAAKAAVQPDIDALHTMVNEDRPPTSDEWAAHDASMKALEEELHKP